MSSNADTASMLEYFYEDGTPETKQINGCTLKSWKPDVFDVEGVVAPPVFSRMACPKSVEFTGVQAIDSGPIQLFVNNGSLHVNGASMAIFGSSYWFVAGAHVKFSVDDDTELLMLGGQLDLREGPVITEVNVLPSSFGTMERYYDVGNVDKQIDTHINDGAANAWDFPFISDFGLDPPALTVVNCEKDSKVDLHVHPYGAVYMVFGGKICFGQTEAEMKCIVRGQARWTSPKNRYLETFHSVAEDAWTSREIVNLNLISDCEAPVYFAVTNFDVASSSGVPNFEDIPDETKPLLVRSTIARARVVEL